MLPFKFVDPTSNPWSPKPSKLEVYSMFTLSLKDSGRLLGTIDEADVRLLVDQLEEERQQDTDYYIDQDTIVLLAESGASLGLIQLLRDAVGEADGAEISWQPA